MTEACQAVYTGRPAPFHTGPRPGFHQCGMTLTGSDTVSPDLSAHDLDMLATALCLYAAL